MTFDELPIAQRASALPPEQWNDLLRKPVWQEGGVGDGGADAGFGDAGSERAPSAGDAPEPSLAPDAAADPSAVEPSLDVEDEGCSLVPRRPRAGELLLWVLASACLLRRRA